MEGEIVNRVAQSSLVQIDLDDFVPKEEIMAYDLAQNLFQGMILKESEFRDFIKNYDWKSFQGKVVALHCSADVIIPNWAFMLFSSAVLSGGGECFYGTIKEVSQKKFKLNIHQIDLESFRDKKVLIKGCGSMEASPEIYLEITQILQPIVKSLMFGEACSTVPVYKRSQ